MIINILHFDVHGDERGQLVSLEEWENVPFIIRRVYYMFGTTPNVRRGEHAHYSLEQILICVHGSCDILLDDGFEQSTVKLDDPSKGLYVRPGIWHEMFGFSPGSVLMVLVSDYYDESDYMRDYPTFAQYAHREKERRQNTYCIRPLDVRDVNPMLEWMHDPETSDNFLNDFNNTSEDQVIAFIKNSISDSHRHFAVVNESDEYLGTVSLKDIDHANARAEYAISMRKSSIGTGAAKAGTLEILNYAFNELNLNKIYLNVLTTNGRAKRFYQKIGFQYEGRSKNQIVKNGVPTDLDWYGITKKQYLLAIS